MGKEGPFKEYRETDVDDGAVAVEIHSREEVRSKCGLTESVLLQREDSFVNDLDSTVLRHQGKNLFHTRSANPPSQSTCPHGVQTFFLPLERPHCKLVCVGQECASNWLVVGGFHK